MEYLLEGLQSLCQKKKKTGLGDWGGIIRTRDILDYGGYDDGYDGGDDYVTCPVWNE